MRKTSLWILLPALLVLPAAANAAHRKPGLWEVTSSMRFTKGGPQIPPEALAQMKQHGIDPAKIFGGEPRTFKQCLTPEEAAKDENPQIGGKDCTMQNAAWSGNTFHGEMMCHHGPNETHGTFTGTLDGDSYTGNTHVEGSDPQLGGAFVMEGNFSGKWLGPTCGKDDQ